MLKLSEYQKQLQEIVKGQDEAIAVITTTIYKYLMKLYSRDQGIFFEGSTSLLLIGDSGVGKTYLIKQAARLSGLEMIEINAKSVVQEGYTGVSFLEHLNTALKEKPNFNGGIIFVDEIDKICIPQSTSSSDNYHEHLQASWLKYIEGMNVNTIVNKTDRVKIDFNKCLFIFSGAFIGLGIENNIKEIGFHTPTQQKEHLNKALTKYGMLEEFTGRIQEKVIMNQIDTEIYRDLLNTETFCLEQWRQTLRKMDISLHVDYNSLIEEAEKSNLGVRGLIQAVEHEVTKTINQSLDKVDLEKYSPLYTPVTKELKP